MALFARSVWQGGRECVQRRRRHWEIPVGAMPLLRGATGGLGPSHRPREKRHSEGAEMPLAFAGGDDADMRQAPKKAKTAGKAFKT